ncbi:MAG: PQQ-like beta-propeller repeat protein [Acidobacteria bacterium]|nr:PQQ-like beta-propeller repeat protein [Acidobacteriota bacterium]
MSDRQASGWRSRAPATAPLGVLQHPAGRRAYFAAGLIMLLIFVVVAVLLVSSIGAEATPLSWAHALQAPAATPPVSNWPSFRGPGGSGVADGAELPDVLSGVDGTNLAWRTEIPGLAHASPIVWGDRVYLTSAVTSGPPQRFIAELPDSPESIADTSSHRWIVMAIDKRTGEVLWERTAAEGPPRTGRLAKGSFNNSTPATDGQHIVALLGSQGLFCYDVDGNLLWHVDLGVLDAGWFFDPTFQWGMASSPIIYDGKVIVQADVRGGAFIAAFDVADGTELWRTARDEVSSFSTPAIVRSADGVAEIVTNGGRAVRAYDPATGEELWTLTPSSEIAVPTPIFAHGLIFVGSGYLPRQPFYAVRPGGSGDISLPDGRRASRQIAWTVPDGGALISTPIVVGDYLFIMQRDGTVSCFDAVTGVPIYTERIGAGEEEAAAEAAEAAANEAAAAQAAGAVEGETPPSQPEERPVTYTASPVAANGKMYVVTDMGDIHVLEAGSFLRILGTHPLGEAVFATPAISDGMLLVRGRSHLFAFSR